MAKKRKKTKASKKTAVKRKTKKTKVAKARKTAAKSKRKPAKKTRRKAKRAAKPRTLRQRVANAVSVVTDTIRGTEQLRDKLEPPATSATE